LNSFPRAIRRDWSWHTQGSKHFQKRPRMRGRISKLAGLQLSDRSWNNSLKGRKQNH